MKHIKYLLTGIGVLGGIAILSIVMLLVMASLIILAVKIWQILLILLGLCVCYGIGEAIFYKPTPEEIERRRQQYENEQRQLEPDE